MTARVLGMALSGALALVLAGAGPSMAQEPAGRANLVQNAGFEEGAAHWELPEGLMSVDETVQHEGKASLKFAWQDAGQRKLGTQGLPLQPGKRYLIQAWLRSRNVHGAYLGATFGIEWGGTAGFIGGAYPMGVGWDTEWTRVSFLSEVTPPELTWGHVFVTMDWGGIGEAWLDDVSVTEVDAGPVLEWRVTPESVVGDADSGSFTAEVTRAQAGLLADEGAEVALALCSPPWSHPVVEATVPAETGQRVELPTAALPEGVYKVQATLKSKPGGRKLMAEQTVTVSKRPPIQLLTRPQSGVVVEAGGAPEEGLPGAGDLGLWVRASRAGRLSGAVLETAGQEVLTLPQQDVVAGQEVSFRTPGLPAGRYRARVQLTSPGAEACTREAPLAVLTAAEAARGTIIGTDGLLRDRGKVWFPLLIYTHTAYDLKAGEKEQRDWDFTREMLGRLRGTPYGIMDYATPIGGLEETVRLADECAANGVRLALSAKDVQTDWPAAGVRMKSFPGMTGEQMIRALAQRLREHPALGLYYTNDEMSTEYYKSLLGLRTWLHEEDPGHPTLHVHYDLECIRELAPTYDIYGPELYPWPSDDLWRMVEWGRKVRADLPATAPYWGCLWLFRDEPQAAEKQRALTYLALATGARGLLYYSWHDLRAAKNYERRWQDMVELGRELEARLPVLLLPEAAEGCRTETAGVVLRTVSGATAGGEEGSWLLAVNCGNEAREALVRLPAGVTGLAEGETSIGAEGGVVRMGLEPYGVKLLKLTR
jgi:hypothetical protein